MPEPQAGSESAARTAARAVRDALQLRDAWTAELEAAWAEWSRDFPHVDERTALKLRAAFEAGYRQERALPLVIVVPEPDRPDERRPMA